MIISNKQHNFFPFILVHLFLTFTMCCMWFAHDCTIPIQTTHIHSSDPGAIVCIIIIITLQSCANHMQHIEHLSHATCHVACHMVWRDRSAIQVWQSWDHIYLSFTLLAEPLNRWRRGRNRSTRRKPLVTSFRKCHILQSKDSSPKRVSNPHNSIGGRPGKQTC